MQIAVENSTWNNTGDGFYQYSLYSLLQQIAPNDRIAMLDGPVDRAFRPNKVFRPNAFDLLSHQDADVVCLSGPILNKSFRSRYGKLIERLASKGKYYFILSAHGPDDKRVVEANKAYFKEYPPAAFSSRDHRTYEHYRDICDLSYNGLCFAFFVSQILEVAEMEPSLKYITSSFYGMLEPHIEIANELGDAAANVSVMPRALVAASKWGVARHFEWLVRYPRHIRDYLVVRPEHGVHYYFSHLNFPRPNTFISFNPLSYLSLYKGTSLTLSNRVHACVVTLSYGKPARYIGSSQRMELFERVGLYPGEGNTMQLSTDCLDNEYRNQRTWLSNVLAELSSRESCKRKVRRCA